MGEVFYKGLIYAEITNIGSVYFGETVRVTCYVDNGDAVWMKCYMSDGKFSWFKDIELEFPWGTKG